MIENLSETNATRPLPQGKEPCARCGRLNVGAEPGFVSFAENASSTANSERRYLLHCLECGNDFHSICSSRESKVARTLKPFRK